MNNRVVIFFVISTLAILCAVFFLPFNWGTTTTYEAIQQTELTTASKTPVVYLMPHQDDEMFMAGSIKANLDAGHPVYVVMVTDGSASEARKIINGSDDAGRQVYSSIDHRIHHPALEGYQPLDKLAFTAERNREFFVSMSRLGVPPEHILFANPGGVAGSSNPVYVDSHLTPDLATNAIEAVYRQVGNGVYNTVASNLWPNYRGDHWALREALLRFKPITEKHFYSERAGWGIAVKLTQAQKNAKYYALRSYFEWDPQHGKFAVGYHSVMMLLDTWMRKGSEYLLNFSYK